jgi:hypothetical protein
MPDPKKTIYERKARVVIDAMAARNIEAWYCDDRAAAVEAICKMVPAGSLVGFGGSVTIVETGLVDALRRMDVTLLDRYRDGVTSQEMYDMRIQGLSSDVFIAGANAITRDGRIVCEDGLGNRVASIIFGPKKVILMVGVNKIVPTLEEAISRIKNVAAPFNSVRFNADTPCGRTGFCDDPNCHPPTRICSQLAIIESNPAAGRLNVVIVGEELGF